MFCLQDDGDYNYLADSSRLQEGEEEWAEEGDINDEEVVDLVRDAQAAGVTIQGWGAGGGEWGSAGEQ